MKQRYAVIVLFALIIASSFTSLDSYRMTSRMVNEDMDRALALAASMLMEMFFLSPTHSLTKSEICAALWPKKPDASETLYTLIKRLKPVIEQHSDLKIESDRGKAYELKIR